MPYSFRREVLKSMICMVWLATSVAAQNSSTHHIETEKKTQDIVHEQQLTDCRAGILDPQARLTERRRWARTLFSYDTPQARAMVVEILSFDNQPKAQAAICSVIQQRVSSTTNLSEVVLVGPLMELLDAPSDEARQGASAALAAYRQEEVIKKLGALCVDASAPTTKRLAAIDALAPNIDRIDVVGQLISILEVTSPTILARAFSALSPASVEPIGSDVIAWRRWWTSKSQLSEQAWLIDRLRLYLGRLSNVEKQYQDYRVDAEQNHQLVTKKLREYQREVFTLSSPDQRDAKIIAWLHEPVSEVKLEALRIIKGHIADEGRRPSDDVLDSLLVLLRDSSTVVRQEVLIIVQTLVDPKIEQALLARMDEELDPTTRETLFRAVGRLNSAGAIPFLVREIDSPNSSSSCVREAAIALGQTASMLNDKQRVEAAAALKRRYAQAQDSENELLAAVLSAMAGVADPSFETEFRTSIDTANSVLIRPAIRGLVALEDISRNPRLRTLCADANALVRRDAVEALGILGREDADVEGIRSRLNTKTETNNLVHEAAWKAFLSILSNKAASQQFKASEGLREFPDVEIRYLSKLSDDINQDDASFEVLDQVNSRLIAVLRSQDKCDEAIPYHQRMYDLRIKRAQSVPHQNQQSAIIDAGRDWLLASLNCRTAKSDEGSVITHLLATSQDSSGRIVIIKELATWIDGQDWSTSLDKLRTISESLRSISPQPTEKDWINLIQRISKLLQDGTKAASP